MENECEVCHNQLHYSEVCDALYCDPCDEWKEKSCDDTGCPYCPNRPDRPSGLERT